MAFLCHVHCPPPPPRHPYAFVAEQEMWPLVRVSVYRGTTVCSKGLVINYGEGGGGLQNGKIAGPKLFAPPPQDRVKLFASPF